MREVTRSPQSPGASPPTLTPPSIPGGPALHGNEEEEEESEMNVIRGAQGHLIGRKTCKTTARPFHRESLRVSLAALIVHQAAPADLPLHRVRKI